MHAPHYIAVVVNGLRVFYRRQAEQINAQLIDVTQYAQRGKHGWRLARGNAAIAPRQCRATRHAAVPLPDMRQCRQRDSRQRRLYHNQTEEPHCDSLCDYFSLLLHIYIIDMHRKRCING